MSYEYSENILVQGAAGDLLKNELHWRVVFAYNKEKLGANGTLGRTDYREILLSRDFRKALLKLNPWLTPQQLDEAEKRMTAHLSTSSLMQINEEKYGYIRDGIPVTVKRPDGKTETKRAQVIDFAHPAENDFLAVKEMKIHGELYRRRTDIVGFVNGIPLLFIELKALDVDVEDAYTCKPNAEQFIVCNQQATDISDLFGKTSFDLNDYRTFSINPDAFGNIESYKKI